MNTILLTTANEFLEPIAEPFRQLGLPQVIVQWGHPLMMGIVVLVMGSYTAWAGWRARLEKTDIAAAAKSRADHRKLAPWVYLFIALGYTGGVLSLVMQKQPVLESTHFWTGTVALVLLSVNGLLAGPGFWGERKVLRTVHAYLGTGVAALLLLHGAFGLKLGLSL